MIMTLRTMDYYSLKAALPEDARILIWSCNTCARICGDFGGRDSAAALEALLTEDGAEVVANETITATCFQGAVRKRLANQEFREKVLSATHVIPLTCKSGAMVLLKEMPHLEVVEVGRTIGLGFLADTGVAVLTDPLVQGLEIPEKGMPLERAAEALGLFLGPFKR